MRSPGQLAPVYNVPIVDPALTACPQCDLVQCLPDLDAGGSARCPRCDEVLWRKRNTRTLALAVAAAALYILVNTLPMMGVRTLDRQSFTTRLGRRAAFLGGRPRAGRRPVLFSASSHRGAQIACVLAVALVGRRAKADG